MNRFATFIAGVAAVAAIAPAASMASTTVGASNIENGTPTKAPNCGAFCTLVHPNQAFGMVSPESGVITKWRIKNGGAFDATATLRVVDVLDQFNETTKGIASGTPEVLAQTDNTFTAQLPIQAGQSIAVDVSGNPKVILDTNFLGAIERYLGGLADGETRTNGNNIVDSSGNLALTATVEPDADGDGLGDESQDPCGGDKANACAATAPGGGNANGPVGLDRRPPKASASFKRSFPKKQALKKGIAGQITSDEAGKADAQLELKTGKGNKAKTLVLGTGSVKLGKPGKADLKLRIGRKSKRRIGAGTAKLKLRITVRDEAGNPTVIIKRISVKA